MNEKSCLNCYYGRKNGFVCVQGGIPVLIVEAIIDCPFYKSKTCKKIQIMNKTCTDIKQSRKLIELGIDVNTADMYWSSTNQNYPPVIGKCCAEYSGMQLPAWSLTALLSIIKPVNGNTYTLKGTLDGGAMISFEEVTNVMFQEEEIIDAVFEMVVWLKENRKL